MEGEERVEEVGRVEVGGERGVGRGEDKEKGARGAGRGEFRGV